MMTKRKGLGKLGFFPAIGLCLILSTCGIDSSAYLEPPTSVSASTDQYYFRHNSALDVDPVFQGYEILYRLYEDKADADADKTNIDNLVSISATTVYTSMVANLKYCRITASDFRQEPLIPRATSGLDSGTVTLNFTSKQTAEPMITIGDLVIPIHRGVQESLNDAAGKGFLNISREDADVKKKSATSTSPDDGMVFFQAYAFSSGIDNDLAMVYSTPVIIGSESKLYLKSE
jgi:hypothetical protein